MPQWKPSPTAVEPAELVGRRLLAKTYERWTVDGVPSGQIRLTQEAFEDTRLGEDLSVDRLGPGAPLARILTRLTEIADDEAAKASKVFSGWVAIAVKELKTLKVIASPLTRAEHGIDNPFHADIDRSLFRQRAQAFQLSVSLRFQFQERGQYVAPLRPPVSAQSVAPQA